MAQQSPPTLTVNQKLSKLPLQVGDKNIVRNRTVRGGDKLQWKWEATPYEVVWQLNAELLVFEVKHECGHLHCSVRE